MANRNKTISDTLSERVKALRKDQGMTQKELAHKLFKSESTVRMWELGKSEPDLETVNKLAVLFGVTSDYLLGRNSDVGRGRSRGIRIPVYGDTAAGVPILAIENYDSDDPDDWEEITPDMARGGDHIALRIKGDSMEPRMKTGDVVIVRLQPDIETGDIAIVRINGDSATCKKVKKTPEGLWLIPFNPNYDPVFYTPEEVNSLPVSIIGRVVELRAKF